MPLLGNIAENKKILRITKINLLSHLATGEIGVHLHTLVDRERKRSRERVDGVVLLVIQITDDRAPNGWHLRVQHTYSWGRHLLLLDPARGRERLMEIQQHDGVVVEVAGISAGLRQAQREGEVLRGSGRRQGLGCAALPPPSLYRGPVGAAGPRDPISRGAVAKGETCPPSPVGAPPPLGFPTLGAGEAQGGRTSPPGAGSLPSSAHGAFRDRCPHPVDRQDPYRGPGKILVTPETFPVAETGLPIYNSSPPDHSGTPRDVRDLIRDSEKLSGYRILVSLQP